MKRDKFVVVTLAAIFFIAVFFLLVAGRMLGWDFLGWFSSDDATWLYIILGIFVFITVGYLVKEWVGYR